MTAPPQPNAFLFPVRVPFLVVWNIISLSTMVAFAYGWYKGADIIARRLPGLVMFWAVANNLTLNIVVQRLVRDPSAPLLSNRLPTFWMHHSVLKGALTHWLALFFSSLFFFFYTRACVRACVLLSSWRTVAREIALSRPAAGEKKEKERKEEEMA
jgi:hypothetical protein